MPISQQPNEGKIICRATFRQRVTAAVVFLVVVVFFIVLRLGATGRVDLGSWFGPCGFRQAYGLPCPGCGMTTSALAFARGKIFDSFYIQPAGGLMCTVFLAGAFFALLMAVFGIYLRFLKRFFVEVKVKYIVVAVMAVVASGWAVTLARALAQRQAGN